MKMQKERETVMSADKACCEKKNRKEGDASGEEDEERRRRKSRGRGTCLSPAAVPKV